LPLLWSSLATEWYDAIPDDAADRCERAEPCECTEPCERTEPPSRTRDLLCLCTCTAVSSPTRPLPLHELPLLK